MKVIYKAEKNGPNDWRVVEYINGEWNNDRERRSQLSAKQYAKYLNAFVLRNGIDSSIFDI